MEAHLAELQDKLDRAYATQHAMDHRMHEDSANMHKELQVREGELLGLQDENLSLKIQMGKLQQQIEQDLDVKEDLNFRNSMFMKNQINELKLKLGAYQSQNNHFLNENPSKKAIDQDGEELPKINASYLNTLADEFNKVSTELVTSKKLLNEKSEETLGSFLNKHIPFFNEFKIRVLDSLVDWYQKSTEHSKLTNKYYDTLEEYKMLFV